MHQPNFVNESAAQSLRFVGEIKQVEQHNVTCCALNHLLDTRRQCRRHLPAIAIAEHTISNSSPPPVIGVKIDNVQFEVRPEE
jgi:hypothetical protein